MQISDIRLKNLQISLCGLCILLSSTSIVRAHSASQSFSIYKDAKYDESDGLLRERWQTNLDIEVPHQDPNKSSTILLNFVSDYYNDRRADSAEYLAEHYDSDERQQLSGQLTYNHEWNKLSSVRVGVNSSSDSVAKSTGVSLGVSRWLHAETWRVSFDVSRAWFRSPTIAFLDQDADSVETPTSIAEWSSILAVRQLASPTTIVDYSYNFARTSNRPNTHILGLGVRQYIKLWPGAVHMQVIRGLNTGRVTTATHYGSVKAWQVSAAYLHDFEVAQLKLAYRAYREDEVTRAYGDELILGTESWNAALVYDMKVMQRDLGLKVGVGHYKTNANVAANTAELGVSTKF